MSKDSPGTLPLKLIKEWAPTNSKGPNEVTLKSHYKASWLCDKGHLYVRNVSDRTRETDQGCPFCTNRKVLPGFNDLATTHPEIAAEWSPVNEESPIEISRGSSKKVEWICNLGHIWITAISNRTRETRPGKCPYCANKKVLLGFNDLFTLYPNLETEWSDTNTCDPKKLLPGSSEKVLWVCSKGHTWAAYVYSRTSKEQTGCPFCVVNISRPEVFIKQLLPDCKTQVWHERITCVDIELGSLIIEYDGWYYHKDTVEDDIAKTQYLLKKGYKVARIRERTNTRILPFLPISHKNLYQHSWKYRSTGEELDTVVKAIVQWKDDDEEDD